MGFLALRGGDACAAAVARRALALFEGIRDDQGALNAAVRDARVEFRAPSAKSPRPWDERADVCDPAHPAQAESTRGDVGTPHAAAPPRPPPHAADAEGEGGAGASLGKATEVAAAAAAPRAAVRLLAWRRYSRGSARCAEATCSTAPDNATVVHHCHTLGAFLLLLIFVKRRYSYD